MTFAVIVRTDKVGVALRYILCFLISVINLEIINFPRSSTSSLSFQNFGKSQFILKSMATHFSFLIASTFAYFIADNESVATEKPAIPNAINLFGVEFIKAICAFS